MNFLENILGSEFAVTFNMESLNYQYIYIIKQFVSTLYNCIKLRHSLTKFLIFRISIPVFFIFYSLQGYSLNLETKLILTLEKIEQDYYDNKQSQKLIDTLITDFLQLKMNNEIDEVSDVPIDIVLDLDYTLLIPHYHGESLPQFNVPIINESISLNPLSLFKSKQEPVAFYDGALDFIAELFNSGEGTSYRIHLNTASTESRAKYILANTMLDLEGKVVALSSLLQTISTRKDLILINPISNLPIPFSGNDKSFKQNYGHYLYKNIEKIPNLNSKNLIILDDTPRIIPAAYRSNLIKVDHVYYGTRESRQQYESIFVLLELSRRISNRFPDFSFLEIVKFLSSYTKQRPTFFAKYYEDFYSGQSEVKKNQSCHSFLKN